MKKILFTFTILCFFYYVNGKNTFSDLVISSSIITDSINVQDSIVNLEYFVDNDPGFGNGTQLTAPVSDIVNFNFNVDLNSATNGFHVLFIRVYDSKNNWSSTQNVPFYKFSTNTSNITQLEYFIDTDPGFGNGSQFNTSLSNTTSTNLIVPLQNTPNGFHTLYIRAKDDQNRWSSTLNSSFYKFNTNGTSITQLEYFFDTEPGYGNGIKLTTVFADTISTNFNIPLQNTNEKFHILYTRTKDDQGQWSTTQNMPFHLTQLAPSTGINISQLEYFFDTDPGYGNGTSVTTANNEEITSNFTADLSMLTSSFHSLYIRAKDSLNRWSTTQLDTFSICVAPPKTTQPIGATYLCINSQNINYTTTKLHDTTLTYKWRINPESAGTINWNNTSATTATVDLNENFIGTAYIIAITKNNCGETPSDSLMINIINVPENASTPIGQQLVHNEQTGITYSVAAIPNATSYIWTLPVGATGTSSTNTISVNYNNNAVSGNITVKGNNNCGNGVSDSLYITVSPLPADAGTISGPINVCKGQTDVVYTVPPIAGADYYYWILPAGVIGTSITNSIIVNIGNNTQSDSIKVYGYNSHGNGTSTALMINVNSIPTDAGIIIGDPIVCSNKSGYTYTINPIDNATSYLWALPNGAIGTSSTNSINVSYDTNSVNGVITVEGTNLCGNSTPSSKSIIVNQTPSAPIVTVKDYCGYSVLSTTLLDPLLWNTGETTSSITVYNRSSYSVTTTQNGCTSAFGNGTANLIPLPPTPIVMVQNGCGYSILSTTSTDSLLWNTGATSSSITVYNTNTYTVTSTINGCTSLGGSGVTSPITPVTQNINIVATSNPSYQDYLVTYTANVDHPLNGQNYKWHVNNSLKDSLFTNTFTYVPNNGDTITCTLVPSACYSGGNSNPIIMNVYPQVLPFASGIISGNNPVCQGQNNVVYTIPVIPNVDSYIWTLPSGATGTSNTNSIIVNFGNDAISDSIKVKGHNLMGDGIASSIFINVNPLPSGSGIITGENIVCKGQNNVSYNVTNINNATSYIWTMPLGASGSNSIDTIKLNYSTSSYSGYLTVCGHNSCGNGGLIIDTIIVTNTQPDPSGAITGQTIVCQGQDSVIYSVPEIANATSYIWNLPTGANGISNTNYIKVNYGTSAISGNITVKGHNKCGDGIEASLPITINHIPDTAGIITGLTNVCSGEKGVVYTVSPIQGAATYIWTLPASITGNSSSNSITVNFGNSPLTDTIKVRGQNTNCYGVSSTLIFNINIIPAGAGIIMTDSLVYQGQSVIVCTVPTIQNATSYIWTFPNGNSDTSSSNSIMVNYASLAFSGNISVKGHSSCGDGISSSHYINVNSSKILHLTAMLQEYFNSSTGLMNQTLGINWDTGDLFKNFSGTTVDTVTVLIRKTNISADLLSSFPIDTVFYGVNLNNNGLITISLSAGITGYHYIEIKHRNSIETWSDSVDFSTDTIRYDFYNHISQFALDGGMFINNNHAFIWGGDVNQNGNLESADATFIYVSANSDDPIVNNGYVICDIDGNGNLDSQDYGLAYNNANIGANIINPFSYLKKK
ncbi:MAG: hypothetical protein WCL51_01475 [Bacteroidota bacterium]